MERRKKDAVLAVILLVFGAAAVVRSARADAQSGYKSLDFADLSDFEFVVPEPSINDFGVKRFPPKLKSKIPDRVRALSGKKVEINGYMLPVEQGSDDRVTKFVLMRNQITCCFGHANRVNEYVMVSVPGKAGVRFTSGVPVTVRGTLEVGAQFEDGVFNSLYQMTEDDVKAQR